MAELCFSSKKNKRAGVEEILSDGEKLSVTNPSLSDLRHFSKDSNTGQKIIYDEGTDFVTESLYIIVCKNILQLS